MRIQVKVKPNSKQEKLDKLSDAEFTAYVKQPPYEGRANIAVIKLLSEYFDIPKSMVIIVRGEKSKNKIFEIMRN